MVDSTDHVSGKTGLSPSVSISKVGGTFATAGGTVSEVGSGWYKIALTATDTNTLGDLAYHITATGADPTDFVDQVIAVNPLDSNLALANLDAAVSSRASATDYTSARAAKLDNLDTTISSRAPAATALSNATWTDTKAGYLDAAISSRSTLTAADVWGYTTRALTDKLDFALSASSRAAIVDEVWDELRSGHVTSGTFGEGVTSVQGNVTGSVGSVTSGVTVSTNNDKTGYGLADGAITSAKFASGAITSSAIATDAIGSSQFAQAAADKIWNTTIRTITGGTITTNSDKTGYSLSASGIDAIWDATGTLSISFETLLQRAYEIVNNKMTVNETSGAVTLLSIGGGSTIATGSVTSSSGTTTRNELNWA